MPITTAIVRLNVVVTPAPQPNTLQQQGAAISLGATANAASSIIYYSTLVSALAAVNTSGNYVELTAMLTTHFAQGSQIGIYILELGTQATSTLGVGALTTWLTSNPNKLYGFLIPAAWDASPGGGLLNTLASTLSSPTGRTYFFTPTTAATIGVYSASNKAIVPFVPAAAAPSTEYGAAALMYNVLAKNPSAASPAGPLGYQYVFGVTPWVNDGTTTTALGTILTAYGNVFLTGAEGGISDVAIFKGTTVDGNQFMFWYGIDWLQITAKQRLAAYMLNGANRIPPLAYNQFGINELLAVCESVGIDGATFGLVEQSTFAATSFKSYVTAHPDDYAAGIYNGLSGIATPQVGFESIQFNLDATAIPF